MTILSRRLKENSTGHSRSVYCLLRGATGRCGWKFTEVHQTDATSPISFQATCKCLLVELVLSSSRDVAYQGRLHGKGLLYLRRGAPSARDMTYSRVLMHAASSSSLVSSSCNTAASTYGCSMQLHDARRTMEENSTRLQGSGSRKRRVHPALPPLQQLPLLG